MKWKTKLNWHIICLSALLSSFFAYAQCTYAENGTLISPLGEIENATPAFTWNYDPDATWYKLWVGYSGDQKIFVQWYEASDVCVGDICSTTIDLSLANDEYEWFVKYWNENESQWSDGAGFIVQANDTPPSKVTQISPSSSTQDPTPTYTWEEDPVSTWYKLWVGYPDGERVFGQWYESIDICSGGNCSVTLESELLNGDYEWWIKSWNKSGSQWSDGIEFAVDAGSSSNSSDADFEATDWTTETHSKSADPDFDEVFDDAMVKRLDFVITEERWQSMLDDMTDLYGEFGSSNTGPPNFDGGLTDVDDPIFVPAEVFYNGKEWYRVGLRFKGNSSLQNSWDSGILKLSFKLDFDEFEDDYPQIKNQRFYGFKKLSLKNNYNDSSFMREKVAAKVFENSGLVVSHTAFYTLYVDHGNGPEYFGLYTLVEEVDNTVIKTQFSDDDGNLYKPEDSGASFVNGTFNETDFEKKTNEDEEDWSDIIALFAALHDGSRTDDPASWRANLDVLFNTDVFLKYLAVNTVIQNWDTYGRMTQNYFLYNDPDSSKLTWIPWDMNEALQEGKMGGSLALNFSNIQTGGWPLIEYLYADEVYRAKYDAYVEDTINVFFEENQMSKIYAAYSALIEPYATSEIQGYSFLNNSGEFWRAMSELNQHLSSRASAVADYLD